MKRPRLPQSGPVTINYIYDSLYRLEEANYSTAEYSHYTYDTVGNRLTETTYLETNTYTYDNANRLASVNSVNYTFDNNGNLLSDGVNTYAYDSANRLISDSTITYSYNGLGDRYQQTVGSQTTTYVLDLNAGLTQVLDDGDNSYLYGLGRISQVNTGHEYFMGDALGSVRQLTDTSGTITLAKAYEPYGETMSTAGSGVSAFAYTGEQVDPNGLVYLRARYYSSGDGRFLSRDTWDGDVNRPLSLNRWGYVEANPMNLIDPTGNFPTYCHEMPSRIQFEDCVRKEYGVARPRMYDLMPYYANPLTLKDQPGCHYYVSPDSPIPYDAEGYLEGYGVTTLISFASEEIVYDFSTMTRASFRGDGLYFSDSPLGTSSNVYFGFIGHNIPGTGFSSQRDINDYGGCSYFDNFGISSPTENLFLPSVGLNRTRFASCSLNPLIGETSGISYNPYSSPLDFIPILELGAGYSNANLDQQSIKPYTYRNPSGLIFVNSGALAHDILFGDASPWSYKGAPARIASTPLLPARLYAINLIFAKWERVFTDLHNGDNSESLRTDD